MGIFKDASPRRAGADLIGVLREKRTDRLPVLALACLPPLAIFLMVNADVNRHTTGPEREITYFESWPASRTREESLAANRERQKDKDARMAAQREAYKALGRAAGMDVEKLEAEALENEAKRKAEHEKAIAESLKPTAGAAK